MVAGRRRDSNIRPTRSQSWIAAVAGLLMPDAVSSATRRRWSAAWRTSRCTSRCWRRCSGRRCSSTSPERLARLLWLLLICSGINSAVGVLQVYDPARWLPAEFSRFLTENADMGSGPVTLHRGARRAARPAAGTLRHAGRGGRARHVGGPARARVCHERHRRLEACARRWRFAAAGLRGHLPESGADQPGDRRGDAGDLRQRSPFARSVSRARASSRCSRAERWSARSSWRSRSADRPSRNA